MLFLPLTNGMEEDSINYFVELQVAPMKQDPI